MVKAQNRGPDYIRIYFTILVGLRNIFLSKILSFDVSFIPIGAVSTSERSVKLDQLSIDIRSYVAILIFFRRTTAGVHLSK